MKKVDASDAIGLQESSQISFETIVGGRFTYPPMLSCPSPRKCIEFCPQAL